MRTATLYAALAAALLCSTSAVAEDKILSPDDVVCQSYKGIHFNRGAEHMTQELAKEGYKLVEKTDRKITLQRDEKAGPSLLELHINEANELYQVIRNASENKFSKVQDATKALIAKCDALATSKSSDYEQTSPLQIAKGEDVAKGLSEGKEYSCSFSKIAHAEDIEAYRQAMIEVDPVFKSLKTLPASIQGAVHNRIFEHGFRYHLTGDEGAYVITEETIDFHY